MYSSTNLSDYPTTFVTGLLYNENESRTKIAYRDWFYNFNRDEYYRLYVNL